MSGAKEGLTHETSALETLYGGQFLSSIQLKKPNLSGYTPSPTQHHSFFSNLPLLLIVQNLGRSHETKSVKNWKIG